MAKKLPCFKCGGKVKGYKGGDRVTPYQEYLNKYPERPATDTLMINPPSKVHRYYNKPNPTGDPWQNPILDTDDEGRQWMRPYRIGSNPNTELKRQQWLSENSHLLPETDQFRREDLSGKNESRVYGRYKSIYSEREQQRHDDLDKAMSKTYLDSNHNEKWVNGQPKVNRDIKNQQREYGYKAEDGTQPPFVPKFYPMPMMNQGGPVEGTQQHSQYNHNFTSMRNNNSLYAMGGDIQNQGSVRAYMDRRDRERSLLYGIDPHGEGMSQGIARGGRDNTYFQYKNPRAFQRAGNRYDRRVDRGRWSENPMSQNEQNSLLQEWNNRIRTQDQQLHPAPLMSHGGPVEGTQQFSQYNDDFIPMANINSLYGLSEPQGYTEGGSIRIDGGKMSLPPRSNRYEGGLLHYGTPEQYRYEGANVHGLFQQPGNYAEKDSIRRSWNEQGLQTPHWARPRQYPQNPMHEPVQGFAGGGRTGNWFRAAGDTFYSGHLRAYFPFLPETNSPIRYRTDVDESEYEQEVFDFNKNIDNTVKAGAGMAGNMMGQGGGEQGSFSPSEGGGGGGMEAPDFSPDMIGGDISGGIKAADGKRVGYQYGGTTSLWDGMDTSSLATDYLNQSKGLSGAMGGASSAAGAGDAAGAAGDAGAGGGMPSGMSASNIGAALKPIHEGLPATEVSEHKTPLNEVAYSVLSAIPATAGWSDIGKTWEKIATQEDTKGGAVAGAIADPFGASTMKTFGPGLTAGERVASLFVPLAGAAIAQENRNEDGSPKYRGEVEGDQWMMGTANTGARIGNGRGNFASEPTKDGKVFGPGTKTSDSIPAVANTGDFIIPSQTLPDGSNMVDRFLALHGEEFGLSRHQKTNIT